MIRIRDRKNFACALMFGAFAAVLAASALKLRIGSVGAMGPGYFPLVLALILGALALAIGIGSLRAEHDTTRDASPPVDRVGWRAVTMVTLAIVVFGASIQRLGFVPALVLSLVITLFAKPRFGWRAGALLTLVLLAGCWLVFVRGLGLPVRLFAF